MIGDPDCEHKAAAAAGHKIVDNRLREQTRGCVVCLRGETHGTSGFLHKEVRSAVFRSLVIVDRHWKHTLIFSRHHGR